MIVVDVTLVSAIDDSRTKLGSVHIFNDGTGTLERGNYGFRCYGRSGQLLKRSGAITNWPRLQRTGMDLLAAVLKKAYP